MLCHGEVFRLRPAPAQLTSFYLHIAAGGAAGAFLVAVIAPLVFDRFLELQLGLWLLTYFVGVISFQHRSVSLAYGTAAGALAATILVPALKAMEKNGDRSFSAFGEQLQEYYVANWGFIAFIAGAFLLGVVGRRGWAREWRWRVGNFLMLFSVGLGILLVVQIRRDSENTVSTSRDFYGVLKVFEHDADDADMHHYTLVHGATSHGLQFVAEPQASWPTTYYGETSGIGLAIEQLSPLPRRNIGLVGLGTGTVAIYGRLGDHVRIYEIDPHVEKLARTRFTYLARSAAHVDVVIGDARLSMERELENHQPQNFDVLALDAFSSDAIPVHLLTKEAFAIYFAHLKPDGVLAVHTSNRYLDLQPVVEQLARHFGFSTLLVNDSPPAKKWWLFRSTWILVARNPAVLANPDLRAAAGPQLTSLHHVGLGTDDYTSLYEILK